MRHAIAHRKLGRTPGHRKALLRNMMNALVRSERIETTVAKAKEVRRLADRLITLGKQDTTHARRRTFSLLCDKGNTEKIFATLAARFSGREGGYTRIVRTGYRAGDGSEMAILEYLPEEEKKPKAKKGKKKKAPAAKEKPAAKTAAPAKPVRTAKKAGGKRSADSRGKREEPEGEKRKTTGKRMTKGEPG
ncbi:MAG: LSU ribosomal protein L17P [Deltaproteobacteria bacterium CSP1-8]|nr:MAG: LSU ribosomal protein L17P [Deltaproteobacteria bacterium CSP1-8]